MKKRILAFLLCFAMVMPILPVNAVTVDDVCSCNTETETHAETCALYIAPAPICTCDAAEGEAHAETCALYVAPAPICTCDAAEGEAHKEECALYVANVPTEETTETTETTTEATEPTEPDVQPPVGTPVGYPGSFNVDGLIVVCGGIGKAPLLAKSSIFPKSFTVEMQYTDAEGTVWYKLSSPEWPILYSKHVFVKAKIVDVEIPESDKIVYAEKSAVADGVAVDVSGNMPENVSLSVTPVEYAAYGTSGSVVGAFDISLLNPDGSEWQPEDGKIGVTLDAASMGLADGSVVNIHHEHGDDITVMSNYLVLDGKLSFAVSGFSIFIVENLQDTVSSEEVQPKGTYEMTAGDEPEIFYWDFEEYTTVDNWYQSSHYSGPCIWHVSNADGAISYEVYETGYETGDTELDEYRRFAPYIRVTPVKAGTATLTMEYIHVTDPVWGNNTEDLDSVSFTIQVNEPEEFHIADKVAENGCLVPTWGEDGEDLTLENVTYKWERDDDTPIRAEALNADGSVNISIDRGGLNEGRDPITYTVTVMDANGNPYQDANGDPYTASYAVLYSNEILNASFETPKIEPGEEAHRRFYNGYPGLYWKTTAPGNTANQLTQDIEIINPNAGELVHGVDQAADGDQYAEVNAEQFGTLYQDILTSPGSTFTWNFSHTARDGGQNTLYVVVAGTEYAQNIVNADNINALLKAAKDTGEDIPYEGNGLEFTYDGHQYTIWKHEATQNWEKISGTYTVPTNQYLTRLFFASETANGNNTMGNLIDGVEAGEGMSYRVEYYLGDETEKPDSAEGGDLGSVYTTVELEKLQEYLGEGYIVTSVTANDVTYPGDITKGLYITSYGTSAPNDVALVVKVYLKQRAITVTKNVDIEDWDKMTNSQKTALVPEGGYRAEFELYDEEKLVAVADATIDTFTTLEEPTVVVEFTKTPDGATFKPVLGKEYTVQETRASPISGYAWTGDSNQTVTLTEEVPAASVTFTNTYEVATGDLTITKKVAGITDYSDQSFTFKVVDDDNVSHTVTLNLDNNWTATLNDLPIGTATVTETKVAEIGNYELEKIEAGTKDVTTNASATVEVTKGNAEITFTNTYKLSVADLTIKKSGINYADGNAPFVFNVKGGDIDIDVVIYGNNDVTITDLPIAEYTVTEVTGYWRYDVSKAAPKVSQKVDLSEVTEVTFNNTRTKDQWLDDFDTETNKFN